jgi:hypothetical protein
VCSSDLTETGLKAEFSRNGARSRIGRKRVDLAHTWLDPFIVGGPWILAAYVVRRLFTRKK